MKVWVWKVGEDIEVSPRKPVMQKACEYAACTECVPEWRSPEAISLCRSYGLFPKLRNGGNPRVFELTAEEIK